MQPFTIVIHGGAGTISRKMMSPELEKKYLGALEAALKEGYQVLEKGGTALSAVESAVVSLEDNELFNAGKGSVFTASGTHEMDAAIMDGKSGRAGAVAGVRNIRNPVCLATAILRDNRHVLLSGDGARDFAAVHGIIAEPDEYFHTEFRQAQWMTLRGTRATALDHSDLNTEERKFGTVGAVALDMDGNLAAATSTGGLTNKQFGRIGDSPLIGCGTYANNDTCAISCTGEGEYFIRLVAAFDVHALMKYKAFSLEQAIEEVAMYKLSGAGGEGGIIGVDRSGIPVMKFNSEGMYRGFRSSNGSSGVFIY